MDRILLHLGEIIYLTLRSLVFILQVEWQLQWPQRKFVPIRSQFLMIQNARCPTTHHQFEEHIPCHVCIITSLMFEWFTTCRLLLLLILTKIFMDSYHRLLIVPLLLHMIEGALQIVWLFHLMGEHLTILDHVLRIVDYRERLMNILPEFFVGFGKREHKLIVKLTQIRHTIVQYQRCLLPDELIDQRSNPNGINFGIEWLHHITLSLHNGHLGPPVEDFRIINYMILLLVG